MLNSLTSFRFIAALMVFIFHMGILSNYQLGAAGIQFFFVLSGFILAYNYHSKFINLDFINIKQFYKARFAKIYPVHFLTFLISVPLVILSFNPTDLYFIKFTFMSLINLFLVQSFIPNQGTYFNFNGVSWTLSVEAFFYLSFPFLMWLFKKVRLDYHLFKTSLIFFLVWIILFGLNKNVNEGNHFDIWLLHIFPISRLFEFSVGMLLGLIFVKKINKPAVNQALFSIWELFSILLFIGAFLYSISMDVGTIRGVYYLPVWCLLIIIFAYQAGIISKLLSNKYLVFLGESSFSFYMIHQLVIRYVDFLNIENNILRLILCFIISIVGGIIIYQFYEEPLRKKIRFSTIQNKEVMREVV